jgi:hypothetical protein
VHAVLITFTSAADPAELVGPFEQYATALRAVPGLIAKTWLADGSVLGGFHLFESAAAADQYVTGPLFASVRENPQFSNVDIVQFEVLEPLSAITNGLGASALAMSPSSDG